MLRSSARASKVISSIIFTTRIDLYTICIEIGFFSPPQNISRKFAALRKIHLQFAVIIRSYRKWNIHAMHTSVRCMQSGRAQSYIIVNRSFSTQTGRRKQSAQSKISLYLRKVTFLPVGISRAIANLHYVSGVLLLLFPSSFSSLSSFSSARSLRLAISNWLCVSWNWIYINAIETSLKLKAPFTGYGDT